MYRGTKKRKSGDNMNSISWLFPYLQGAFPYRIHFDFTIDFISADMDETLDSMDLGRLQKNVSSHYVVLSKLKAVSK